MSTCVTQMMKECRKEMTKMVNYDEKVIHKNLVSPSTEIIHHFYSNIFHILAKIVKNNFG